MFLRYCLPAYEIGRHILGQSLQRRDARDNTRTISMNANSRRMLRTEGAAAYVGLSVSTMNKFRLTGGGPLYVKLSRSVVYDTADLDAWLDAHRRSSTSVVA
jgi:predicted DNA-binding transcriptional regulator AlpA